MKLPNSRKKSTVLAHPALCLLQQAEQVKAGGTSPTQRAYRSHTSDLITRLDRLLAPYKKSSADAKKNADAQGAKPAAGPFKSRARNVVLRDLVDILTKIWRDDQSFEILEGNREEIVPSPPPVGDDVDDVSNETIVGNNIAVANNADAPQKTEFTVKAAITVKTEINEMCEISSCEPEDHVASDLQIGSFNTGSPLVSSWPPAVPEIKGESTALTSVPVLGVADEEMMTWLEQQPDDYDRETSSSCASESEDDFEMSGLMMDGPPTPPDEFEAVAPSKGAELGFGWTSAFAEEMAVAVW